MALSISNYFGVSFYSPFWEGYKLYLWLFPKIGGNFLGVPIIRTQIIWILDWSPLCFGKPYKLLSQLLVFPLITLLVLTHIIHLITPLEGV